MVLAACGVLDVGFAFGAVDVFAVGDFFYKKNPSADAFPLWAFERMDGMPDWNRLLGR